MVRKASLRRCHLGTNLTDEKRAAEQKAGVFRQTDRLAWLGLLPQLRERPRWRKHSSGGSRSEMVAGPQ